MSRQRSTNRTKALKLWISSGRTMKFTDVGAALGVSDALIRKWKFLDRWDEIPEKRPRGAPVGNQNGKGNKGGSGGPAGNDKAIKHGLYSKFLPQDDEFQELMDLVQQMEPLDMLWQAVEIGYAKLMWAQRVMFVTGKDEMIKELKKQKFEVATRGRGINKEIIPVLTEEEFEFQFAWDRQATDIKAYSAISREFRSAMKQFLSAAPENDERRMKLALMETQIEKVKADIKKIEKEPGNGNEVVIIIKGEDSLED